MLGLIPLAISIAPEIGRWLFGAKGEEVAGAVSQVVQTVTGTSDAAVAQSVIARDPKAAADLRLELAKIAAAQEQASRQADLDELKASISADQMQADVNRAEASSPSLWVAGWRPFIGWVCGCGLVWQFIVAPALGFAFARALPVVDMSALMQLLVGMLGLGALRTYEKVKGVAGGHG